MARDTQRRLRLLTVGVTIVATTSGCRLSNLAHIQLVKDDRLTFVTPTGRELVKTPLTVAWRTSGTVTGSYAVFVDRAPIGVGDTLRAVAKGDRACTRNPTCPDTAYLNSNNVYVTTAPSVTIPMLPTVADGVGDEQHEVTVVLLDATGTRRTESAWYVDFRYPRRSSE